MICVRHGREHSHDRGDLDVHFSGGVQGQEEMLLSLALLP